MLIIEGIVKSGTQQGRRIGFRTINISVPRTVKSQQWGIYFTLVKVAGSVYPGITHLGPVKTFSLRRKTCETYLLTLHKNLYGHRVTKVLLFKFRDIEKFPTVAQLKKQIRADIKAAKKFFGL